jgi:hypothetical protein
MSFKVMDSSAKDRIRNTIPTPHSSRVRPIKLKGADM